MRLAAIRNQRLIQFAIIAAGAAMFFAPFRSSAGLRGGLLVLAGAAILWAYSRAGQLRLLLPPDKMLGVAVAVWLATTSIWSLLGPSPVESLSVVKRDVLTTALAFFVFYALTRTRADLLRWVCILTSGLVVLTVTIIVEQTDPRASGPARLFGDVGWLSAWLVMVAPLLVVLAFTTPPHRRTAIVLLMVALPCLIAAAWLSGNRMAWICFASTVLIAAGIAKRGRNFPRNRSHSLIVAAILLLMIGLFMVSSMQSRAEAEVPGGAGPVALVLHDSRAQIWRVAWEMIREHPYIGYGYNNPDIAKLFAAHFDPGWRHLLWHAHNVVLNYVLQMGATGAAVIIFLFVAALRAFVTRMRGDALARLAGYCGVALVVAVILRNSTDDFFSRHGAQFFGAFVGMLLGLGTRRPALVPVPAN